MAKLTSAVEVINRNYQLKEFMDSGRPYMINMSDIRDLIKGEKDTRITCHTESCESNPNNCGQYRRGNGRCASADGKIFCLNREMLG